MSTEAQATTEITGAEKSAKTKAMVVYALQIAGILTGGLTGLVGLILNYAQKNEVQGTLAESHFRWQMRTFWFALLWLVLSMILAFAFIGYFTALATSAWVIYRIVRGWLALNEGKPMYQNG